MLSKGWALQVYAGHPQGLECMQLGCRTRAHSTSASWQQPPSHNDAPHASMEAYYNESASDAADMVPKRYLEVDHHAEDGNGGQQVRDVGQALAVERVLQQRPARCRLSFQLTRVERLPWGWRGIRLFPRTAAAAATGCIKAPMSGAPLQKRTHPSHAFDSTTSSASRIFGSI